LAAVPFGSAPRSSSCSTIDCTFACNVSLIGFAFHVWNEQMTLIQYVQYASMKT
jgi:hypothetical protein